MIVKAANVRAYVTKWGERGWTDLVETLLQHGSTLSIHVHSNTQHTYTDGQRPIEEELWGWGG